MNKRIKKIRRELDLTQEEFAKRLGIKRNTVANYETGRNKPVDSVIALICREYNVNEDWLRTGYGEMFKASPSDELDALAKKYDLSNGDYIIIEKFVNLKAEKRATIVDYILQTAAAIQELDIDPEIPVFSDNETPQDQKIIPLKPVTDNNLDTINIPFSDLPVSAGIGIDVSQIDEDKNEIEVILDDNSRLADYVLRVKGDSMEPRFANGDLILVRKVPALLDELGIFYLNGSGYFKKLGINKLISLNPKYEDVDLDDINIVQFENQGKVLGKAQLPNTED